MTSTITVPVSIGEAIDKQTILEIKLDKLKSGREFIEKELALLSEKISAFLDNDCQFHKNTLRIINEEIWDLQDDFRIETNHERRVKLCVDIILLNDSRFRVKKKLDTISNSSLREQKGYQKNKAFFLCHLGLGDQINCIPIVRYLASRYDQVTLVCKKIHQKNLELIYQDDPSIELYLVDSDEHISPTFGFSQKDFENITSGFTVLRCGKHQPKTRGFNFKKKKIDFTDIPFCFYKDLKLSTDIFGSYHHIASLAESLALYKTIQQLDYIITHTSSSQGQLIDLIKAESALNVDKDKILLIDINNNYYPQGHHFHDLAARFIGLPLPYYKNSLIHAKKLLLSDSSLFCMAISLPVECEKFYYISRDDRDYSYISSVISGSRKSKELRLERLS
jgi:hypothetical protein